MKEKTYLIEGLDCANCASKIENKISNMQGIKSASVDFTTRKLRVKTEENNQLFDEIATEIKKIEPEATLIDPDKTASIVSHEHSRECGCKISNNGHVFNRVYDIRNLCCEICASEIEKKLLDIDSVTSASVAFTTGKIFITSIVDPDTFLEKIQKACNSVHHDISLKEHSHGDHNKNNNLTEFWVGTIIFIIAFIVSHIFGENIPSVVMYVVSYLLLGYKVLFSAAKNLCSGRVFDENFLMSIATLGAIAIGNFPEATAVMLFFQIGELFEHRAVEKSRASITSVLKLRPETVTILDKSGNQFTKSTSEAKIGDLMIVKVGDRVPLDAVVYDGNSDFDMSIITGESVPISASKGDEVYAGAVNLSGQIVLKITHEEKDSMISRVLESVEHAAANKPQAVRFLTKFSRIYTPVVVICALLVSTIPALLGFMTWHESIYSALSFLVISCPCALVLSVPLAFFAGIGKASSEGILFKGGNTLEALSGIKAIAMDKTGTLTKGQFSVTEVIAYQEEVLQDDLLKYAFTLEQTSKHPIAVGICNFAKNKNLTPFDMDEIKEIIGYGMTAKINKLDVICGKEKLLKKFNIHVPIIKSSGVHIHLAVDGKYFGYITLRDSIKDNAQKTILALKKKGIRTVILTGDSKENTDLIAKELNVDETFSELLPNEKLKIVQNLQKDVGPTMFVGDGVNDAPVLVGSDVGAAMGSGADASIESADIVYMNSDVSSIENSLNLAKKIRAVAHTNIAIALTVKVAIMLLATFGNASMWAAVIADTGVALLCILNSVRLNLSNFSIKNKHSK